jgi:VIT1/CCC1 family predicted Fe2+/Mn2+ transporter
MTDLEFIQKQLDRSDEEEREALGRIAKTELTETKMELAAAKERLEGARCLRKVFLWEREYLNEHGRLP